MPLQENDKEFSMSTSPLIKQNDPDYTQAAPNCCMRWPKQIYCQPKSSPTYQNILISRIENSKIISNALANHMSTVMEKIISKPQNTFVRDRQILDAMLIANEYLDSQLRKGASSYL